MSRLRNKRIASLICTRLTMLFVCIFFWGEGKAQSSEDLIGRCITFLEASDSIAFRKVYPDIFIRYAAEASKIYLDSAIHQGDRQAVQSYLESLTAAPESDALAYYYLSNTEYHPFFRSLSGWEKYERWLDSVKSVPYADIRNEIWRIQCEDQGIRVLWINLPKETADTTKAQVRNEMRRVDERNTRRAAQILDAFGKWPGADVLGASADQTLWLCIQHADQRPEVAVRYLPMLKAAVDEKRTVPMYYAYLVDRIRMHEGREQVYGTQTYKIKEEDGRSFFFVVPIEDVEHVDERRAAMGMGPLAEYLEGMGQKWDLVQYQKDLPKIWTYYRRSKMK